MKTKPEKVELVSLQKNDDPDIEKVPMDDEPDIEKVPMDNEPDIENLPVEDEPDIEKVPMDDEKADVATTETSGRSLGRGRTIVSQTETLSFKQDYDEPPRLTSITANIGDPVESLLQVTPTDSLLHKGADEATSPVGEEKTYVLKRETIKK